jgi:hypothetical protein
MWLKNPLVYIQFHPLSYMVKLHIEMSMASLILQLARGGSNAGRNTISVYCPGCQAHPRPDCPPPRSVRPTSTPSPTHSSTSSKSSQFYEEDRLVSPSRENRKIPSPRPRLLTKHSSREGRGNQDGSHQQDDELPLTGYYALDASSTRKIQRRR